MKKHNVHTTIPHSDWMLVEGSETSVSWQELLTIGIRVKFGDIEDIAALKLKLAELEEKDKEIQREKLFFSKKLDKLVQQKEKDEKLWQQVKAKLHVLEEVALHYRKNINWPGALEGHTGMLNKRTGMSVTTDEFKMLVRKLIAEK